MIHIKTPATTANMGCGFDSIGMALQLYNHLWVEETDGPTEIKNENCQFSTPANNLIYQTMADFYKKAGKKMPDFLLIQEDSIPCTRGLGSSSACVVSGLLAANALSKLNLPLDALIKIAAKIEGHPDNSTPAFLGGLVVGALSENDLHYVKLDAPDELTFAVMIPAFPLSTEKARNALPKTVPHKDAVFNASRTGLLIASLMTKNFDNLAVAMDDRLHQPYRQPIIPNMENIFNFARENGAKGVFLSGAGPAIIAVAHENKSFVKAMSQYVSGLQGGWKLHVIPPDNTGAVVEKNAVYSGVVLA